MKRWMLCLLAVPFALTACSGVKKTLGVERSAPDEFAVVERAPLTMPPNFGLEPPRPGAPRPQELVGDQRAEAVVFGKPVATSANASASEKAFLKQMDAPADPDIRQKLRGERDAGEATTVTERLGLATPESGKVLNPVEESKRLNKDKGVTPSPAAKAAANQKPTAKK